ncbi:MAG: hypothetical protein M1450_04725 [Patescibacteria group bacterium]|nr:hypothetical protein [Patescibacteria group bacterium]
MTLTVFGMFHEREEADAAIDHLERRGYDPQDISIMMKDNQFRKGDQYGIEVGIPGDRTEYYEKHIKEGGILLAVPAYEEEKEDIADILEIHGAVDISDVKLDGIEERSVDGRERMQNIRRHHRPMVRH